MATDFNNILRDLRKARHLTQSELAQAIGVAKSTISMYELGAREPDFETLEALADFFNVPLATLIQTKANRTAYETNPFSRKGVKIPVLGRVAAGIPIDAVEEIIDYEEIPLSMAATGTFFGLLVKGDSMIPDIKDGDIVIVRQQPNVENGETAVVLVNGDEATVKRVKRTDNGMMLMPNNPAYETVFYTNDEIANKPVQIVGRVVELRRKF